MDGNNNIRQTVQTAVQSAAQATPNATIIPTVRCQTYISLQDFAERHGFTVTSTTGGDHNANTRHATGQAIDVRTRNKTVEEGNAFIQSAREAGYNVRDERIRPANQRVWSGPHIHISSNECD